MEVVVLVPINMGAFKRGTEVVVLEYPEGIPVELMSDVLGNTLVAVRLSLLPGRVVVVVVVVGGRMGGLTLDPDEAP